MRAEFPPELRLLLSAVRAALGTATPPESSEKIDWEIFLLWVERHRVGAMLHQRLARSFGDHCPAGVVQRLRHLATDNLRRALAQASEQVTLIRLLKEHQIDVLSVKGLVLSQQLYGNLHTRPVGDIDLILRPTDAARADELIQRAGWRRINPDFPLTPLQLRKFVEIQPEFEYWRDEPPSRVELRWRLEGPGDIAALIPRALKQSLGGPVVHTLPADFNAVYLLQHGARHGWFRLFWLIDIASMMRGAAFAPEALLKEARAADAERSVWQGCALVEELLGVPCPEILRPPPRERRVIARLCADARWMLSAELGELASVRGWLRQLIYRMRLQRTIQGKWAVLTPHLHTPRTWGMWSLPDRWFFLYHLAAPFLWLWRRAWRAR